MKDHLPESKRKLVRAYLATLTKEELSNVNSKQLRYHLEDVCGRPRNAFKKFKGILIKEFQKIFDEF